MKWGFVPVTLYMGPIGLLLYVMADKEPGPAVRRDVAGTRAGQVDPPLSHSASHVEQQRGGARGRGARCNISPAVTVISLAFR